MKATPAQVISILDDTPAVLWPQVAEAVAARPIYPPEVVAAVIRIVGRKRLTEAFGRYHATAMWRRAIG